MHHSKRTSSACQKLCYGDLLAGLKHEEWKGFWHLFEPLPFEVARKRRSATPRSDVDAQLLGMEPHMKFEGSWQMSALMFMLPSNTADSWTHFALVHTRLPSSADALEVGSVAEVTSIRAFKIDFGSVVWNSSFFAGCR